MSDEVPYLYSRTNTWVRNSNSNTNNNNVNMVNVNNVNAPPTAQNRIGGSRRNVNNWFKTTYPNLNPTLNTFRRQAFNTKKQLDSARKGKRTGDEVVRSVRRR